MVVPATDSLVSVVVRICINILWSLGFNWNRLPQPEVLCVDGVVMDSDKVYSANRAAVVQRQNDRDFSASDSFYLTWDKDVFAENMLLPSGSIFPANTMTTNEDFPTTSFKRSLQYSKLQKQLSSNVYKDYRYGAILDYVLLTYLNHDPDFTVGLGSLSHY